MADVFISYSRKDSGFVTQLQTELTRRDREVWVDKTGIAPTAEWMKEIRAAVEGAKAFVIIISPDSVASKVVAEELDHALSQNKRIVPVVCRDVDSSSLPERLAKYNWISMRESDDFGQGVDTLIGALDTDLEWVSAHTRLLVRAIEWEAQHRDKSLLLRGSDLSHVEDWLSKSGLEPNPTVLQTQFAAASRKAATSRQRLVLTSVSTGLVVALVLAVVAVVQRNQAVLQAAIARSRQLATNAQQQLPINPDLALLLVLEAAAIRSTELTEQVLRETVNGSRIRAVLSGYRFGVNAQTMSPDGRLILKPDAGSVHIWNVDDGARVQTLADCPLDIATAAFSPAGNLVATAHADGKVRVWSLATGQKDVELFADSPAVVSAAFDPPGMFLAASYADGSTRLWSLAERRSVWRLEGTPLGSVAQAEVSFSKDGQVLSVERDYERRVYQMPEAAPIHEDSSFFSADGTRWFLETCRACEAELHDAAAGKVASGFGGAFGSSAVFSSDKELLLRAGVCGGPGACSFNAEIFDAESGRLLLALIGHSDVVHTAAFSSNDQFIVTASADNTARVWETATGSLLATLIGHSDEVFSAAFSSNSRSVITASRDGTARVWDAGTGMSRMEIQTGQKSVTRALFVNGSEDILTIDEAGGARRWNGQNGAPSTLAADVPQPDAEGLAQASSIERLVKEVQSTGVRISRSVPSPHYRYLFTESTDRDGGDGILRVWDMSTRAKLAEISPTDSDKQVVVVAISPDDRRVATTEYCAIVLDCDRIVFVRDAMAGTAVRALPGHENLVYYAAFSPNGKTLATSDGLGVIRLWHVDTGTLLAVLRGHDDAARLEFSPDGSSMVSVDREGKVLVYHCESCGSLDFLIERARKRLVRSLTCRERQTYIDESATCT